MKTLRNLTRRKLRTFLTITGIAVGVWALVVFGSMGNKISTLVQGGSDYYRDKVTVSAKGGVMGLGGPMAISNGDVIAKLPGVDVVVPGVALMFSDDISAVSMGTPPMIVATSPGADKGRDNFKTSYASGRPIGLGDVNSSVTVLGSDLARQYNKRVNDTIVLRGEVFTIIGILEPTLTAPDTAAMVPLSAAQRLYLRTLPPLVAAKLNPAEVATSFMIYPTPGVDTQSIKQEIEASLPDTSVMTGKDFDKVVGGSIGILDAILVGIGLISLVVGGLSVINTMAMSIAERTREIGIKRSIGASRARILRELVGEAALIGLIGGLIGLAFGALVVTLANDAGRASGTVLFLLTPSTALTALAFSTFLGAFAGFVPALHAARLDPVSALRYE